VRLADGKTDCADLVVIPEQQLRGSRREMLASIDEAITGLLALRHLIAGTPVVGRAGADGQAVSAGRGYLRTPFAMIGRLFSRIVH